MKTFRFAVAGVAVLACIASLTFAQNHDRGTTELSLKGKSISIDYGQPALNGRTTDDLLGRLQPGGLWRVGANASTTFTTNGDLAFGNVIIPAGVYSIWMQRQADHSWKLLFDQKHGQWGEPTPPASECFAAVPLSDSKPASSVETLTLTLRKAGGGGQLSIHWGTLEETATFKAK